MAGGPPRLDTLVNGDEVTWFWPGVPTRLPAGPLGRFAGTAEVGCCEGADGLEKEMVSRPLRSETWDVLSSLSPSEVLGLGAVAGTLRACAMTMPV